MKKFLLFAAASVMTMAASAQTVIAPPTVEEAQAAGYAGLWGDIKYGYVIPNGTVITDTDDIKVTVDNGSTSKPGANVGVAPGSNLNTNNTNYFESAFYMGSAAGNGSFESVYSLELISDGIKQPYAIFEVEAKKGGELTMYSNRGNNEYTIYVWDRTVNEEAGTYVLASTTRTSDFGKELISKATVGLMEGHKYWIFGSGNGANIHMYQMVYTPYDSENYSVKNFDASKYSTVVAPITGEEAQAAGYAGLWGDIKYGYVIPNGTVITDTDDIKVTVDNGSSSKPGANVGIAPGSNLNTNNNKVFDSAFYMGSAAGNGSFESVYSLELISDGIKQPYAIFEVEAKKGGELTMYSNRGNNEYTIYVWDRTINEEAGTYVLASTTRTGDFGKELISKATVGLMEGHKYWIFGSGNGANIHMYAMGYNSYGSPNYGYTGASGDTGIADVIVDAQPQDDAIYNILGQKVTENYKGLVIKNGKKYIQK